jgi:hypothetical protein
MLCRMVENVSRTALLIGTETAVATFSSGTSLRLKYFSEYLQSKNFKVTVTSKSGAKEFLNQNYDLILISSYSVAGIARLARRRTKTLWFDPYDSWTRSRISLIRSGQILQLLPLVRDYLNILMFPQREITSFISEEDANRHPRFLKKDHLLILPIHFESMVLNQSSWPRLVFVGDGSYGPNQKCLKFLSELGLFTGQEIHIIGKGYRNQSRFPNCKFHGYVSDHLLLWTNDIHLAPIKYGAGLKTKVAMPLTYGLRVIASLESSKGICANRNLKVAKSKQDFFALVQNELTLEWNHANTGQKVYERDDRLMLDHFISELN